MKNKKIKVDETIVKIIHQLHILSLENPVYKNNKSTDMCDLGNEIGFVIGSVIPKMNEKQIKDFISGFKHGVSLTNGTH